MKFFITLVFIFTSLFSFSQSVIGKWKPVFITIDTIMRADVKADTLFINTVFMDENLKSDKDPEFSKQMMEMLFQGMFKKIKEMQEEYFEDHSYKETNSRTKEVKTGKWVYDEKERILTQTLSSVNQNQQFSVSWKDDQMILSMEMQSKSGKKGKLEIVYERI